MSVQRNISSNTILRFPPPRLCFLTSVLAKGITSKINLLFFITVGWRQTVLELQVISFFLPTNRKLCVFLFLYSWYHYYKSISGSFTQEWSFSYEESFSLTRSSWRRAAKFSIQHETLSVRFDLATNYWNGSQRNGVTSGLHFLFPSLCLSLWHTHAHKH